MQRLPTYIRIRWLPFSDSPVVTCASETLCRRSATSSSILANASYLSWQPRPKPRMRIHTLTGRSAQHTGCSRGTVVASAGKRFVRVDCKQHTQIVQAGFLVAVLACASLLKPAESCASNDAILQSLQKRQSSQDEFEIAAPTTARVKRLQVHVVAERDLSAVCIFRCSLCSDST